MFRGILSLFLTLALASSVAAQGQAINGTIEGTVTDSSGGALPGVTVTVTNTDTGASRVVVTNDAGVFRAIVLPLGAYRVAAELQGFRRFEQVGINLSAGQVVVVNVSLDVGAVTETVSVTADAPVVDLGKIEQGRTLTEAEIKTLPLTSRNPYNFALLQPGVVGFETQEFGVPRLTANGALLRVNYQIDGNDNTQKDRAGLRQMPMSEVMIREVKVITSGYAPEFGQTMGLVYNAVTPSGTNGLRGQMSYRFQRQPLVALPFFAATQVKPPTEVNIFTVDNGGPIVRDRTFYFGGFESTQRDLSGGRVITITPANAARLGLTEPAYMPSKATTKFAIGKVDHVVTPANRASLRYIFFDNAIGNNIGGGINSVQRGTDFVDRQHSTAGQLVSTIGNSMLNELRVQYATRAQSRSAGSQAGTGPAITVPGVASFGGPIGDASNGAGFAFTQNQFQVLDNFSSIRGNHAYKFGVSFTSVQDTRTQSQFQLYTFPSIDAYLAARSGVNPLGYTSFQQFFGNPDIDYSTSMVAGFVQDDWRLSPNVKLLYGLRYDVYMPPSAVTNALIATSASFATDKNNWQPRAGLVWTLGSDRRTVLRANTGLMYDQPLNAVYEQAIANDGSTTRGSATFTPTQVGAPSFPNVFSGGAAAASNTGWTVDPEFRIARMWQTNVQVERGIGEHYSASAGLALTKGYDLPVVSNINLLGSTSTLADGRPVFSTAVNAATRVNPTFNAIFSTQALGESNYKALMLQFGRRMYRGVQWDFAYTLGKSEDNAPITNVLSVQGDTGGRSDPASLDTDLGPNILDQRHTFVGSIVAQPQVDIDGIAGLILNNNLFGVAMQFASGLPVTLRSTAELNNDGILSDRPLGVSRNSYRLPGRYNVDMRYSRVFPVVGDARLEFIAEFKNIFNSVQWSGAVSTVRTNAQGTAIDAAGATLALPAPGVVETGAIFRPNGGYEQRQVQLGFKVSF